MNRQLIIIQKSNKSIHITLGWETIHYKPRHLFVFMGGGGGGGGVYNKLLLNQLWSCVLKLVIA